MTAADVLRFCFDELTPAQWWAKSATFDRLIDSRFGALHAAALRAERYPGEISQKAAWPRSSSSTSSRATSIAVGPRPSPPTAWRW